MPLSLWTCGSAAHDQSVPIPLMIGAASAAAGPVSSDGQRGLGLDSPASRNECSEGLCPCEPPGDPLVVPRRRSGLCGSCVEPSDPVSATSTPLRDAQVSAVMALHANRGRTTSAPRPNLPATHDASDISKAPLIELNERLSTGKTFYGTCALWLRRRMYSLTGRINRATVQPLSNRPSLNSGWLILRRRGRGWGGEWK